MVKFFDTTPIAGHHGYGVQVGPSWVTVSFQSGSLGPTKVFTTRLDGGRLDENAVVWSWPWGLLSTTPTDRQRALVAAASATIDQLCE
jgi:hypothetical protein